MIRFATLLISLISSARTIDDHPFKYSVASDAQIRQAIENRYDDTGPAAKSPEYAYNTYSSLQEALVSYVNDPDTKLPLSEKMKFERFVSQGGRQPPIRELPKTVEEYTGFMKRPIQQKPDDQPIVLNRYQLPERQIFYHDPKTHVGILDLRGVTNLNLPSYQERPEPYLLHTEQPLRVDQVIAATPRLPEVRPAADHDQFNPHPQYSFSYGVHDKKTGDSKSAHESRDGGTVRGYYTFVDADGKQRTVLYTADDELGFRATVQRTQTNAQ
ncbi:uncharacterized protein LOC126971184 [Leptidea sinapis]|uniref:uncharacterized protein LOC126971184 n=1 Tax=Leptidea sinapis TaxID=189913 RepID=UPI0021C3D18D|nr:uncharacterized protein LOC126971184 [Leptidea sinapis]